MALLKVTGLKTYFPIRTGILRQHTDDVRAVDDVSFTVEKGTTVGLVGESGSGKSTIGKTLLRLVPATAGSVHFDGTDITNMPESSFRPFRKRMQMIFQDPFGSLNPRHTIRQIVGEALEIHFPTLSAKDRSNKVAALLEKVGLKPEMASRYPH